MGAMKAKKVKSQAREKKTPATEPGISALTEKQKTNRRWTQMDADEHRRERNLTAKIAENAKQRAFLSLCSLRSLWSRSFSHLRQSAFICGFNLTKTNHRWTQMNADKAEFLQEITESTEKSSASSP